MLGWFLTVLCAPRGTCAGSHEPLCLLQFFSDARESESYLRALQDSIKRKYSCDHNTSLSRLEDLLQDSMVSSPASSPPWAGRQAVGGLLTLIQQRCLGQFLLPGESWAGFGTTVMRLL